MFWTSRVAWLPSTPSSCGPASACSRALRTSLTACPVRPPPMPGNSTSSSSDRRRRPVRPPRRLVILPRRGPVPATGRGPAVTDRAPTLLGMIPGDVAVLAVTPPGRGEPCAVAPPRRPLPHRPGGRGRRGRPRGSRPTAPRAGCGGRPRRRPLPSWMPGCRSRGPGTSPRPTASSTAGGARPPASAGRRHTASRSRTCPLRPTGDLFEFAADAPPTEADTLVDAAGHLRGDHEEWLRDPAHLRGLGAGGARDRAPPARRGRGDLGAPGRHGALGVGGRGAVPRAAARRAADRPGAHRAAAGRRRRARGPTTGCRGGRHAARPRRARAAARARPGVDRPAQPRPGARACSTRWGSTCRTPASGCSSRTARCTRWSTPCSTGGATSGSPRPTATGGSTRTSAPTTGCAGGGRPATARPAG